MQLAISVPGGGLQCLQSKLPLTSLQSLLKLQLGDGWDKHARKELQVQMQHGLPDHLRLTNPISHNNIRKCRGLRDEAKKGQGNRNKTRLVSEQLQEEIAAWGLLTSARNCA